MPLRSVDSFDHEGPKLTMELLGHQQQPIYSCLAFSLTRLRCKVRGLVCEDLHVSPALQASHKTKTYTRTINMSEQQSFASFSSLIYSNPALEACVSSCAPGFTTIFTYHFTGTK